MKKYAISLGAVLLCFVTALTYAQAPVPFINLPLVPDATAPGGGDFTLTVNGTGFVSNSVVNWNGVPLPTHFVSGSQLTATVPAADIATATTGWLTVLSPAPGGGTSNTVFFSVTDAATSVAFQSSVISTGQTYPETVASADYNSDGRADLVVANRASNSVSILLGKGDGTFQPPVNYVLKYGIRWAITGDFNGDGKLDLAAGGDEVAQISILLGNGDGTFQPPTEYGTGAGTTWGATADLNGDGKLDLAVAGFGVVSILLGNGDGTFPVHVDYNVAGGFTWVGVGDFDRDGKLDLAVGGTDYDAVSILLGNGDGTFQPHMDYATSGCPRSLVAADLNGDGKLDLAIDDECTSQVSILLGNGDGTFQPRVDYPGVWNSAWINSADFRGDGLPDLFISQYGDFGGNAAALLLGNGDGTFQPPLVFPTGGHGGESGTVTDFNRDGMLDLAIPNSGDNTVSILRQVPPTPVTLVPTNLSFATQFFGTTSDRQTVTISNTGDATLNITSISTSNLSFLRGTNCGSSLAVDESCKVNVAFRPHHFGTITGSLTITDDAPNSPQTVSLTGVGTAVTLLPSNLDFGVVQSGTSSQPQTVTLTNYGARALKIIGVRTYGQNRFQFTQTNTCGTSVPAGGSCTFSVTFTPKSRPYVRYATLEVTDNGGGSPQTVGLSGVGVHRIKD